VQVDATDGTSSTTIQGTLTVVPNGVSVSIDPWEGGAPGQTFQANVYNAGLVDDTYDLTLAGPAALVSTLSVPAVTVASHSTETVTISTGPVSFAAPGDLPLILVATSQTVPSVQASEMSRLIIPSTKGLTASFDPASVALPVLVPASALLLVNNTGNVEGAYTATITETTGRWPPALPAWTACPPGQCPCSGYPACPTVPSS